MTPELTLTSLVLLPIGLGLLGFVEPCSIGSTLLVIKHLENKGAAAKLAQVAIFGITRAVFIGLLGALAVTIGGAFVGFQRVAWAMLGVLYVALGLLCPVGRTRGLMVSLGPSMGWLSSRRGSAALGFLFGLNVPACAAPLLAVLFGVTAAQGAAGASLSQGFLALVLFGLALSLPLIAAVLFTSASRTLDWMAGLSRRTPMAAGVLLVALGLWSIWSALSAAPTTLSVRAM